MTVVVKLKRAVDGSLLDAVAQVSQQSDDQIDVRHIAWLRDQISPEQFAGGVVFHTGRHRRKLATDIEAVPIAGLWG